MLGVQTLAALCLLTWGMLSTFILLWGINKITPIRMDPYEELLGADLCEHNIKHGGVSVCSCKLGTTIKLPVFLDWRFQGIVCIGTC